MMHADNDNDASYASNSATSGSQPLSQSSLLSGRSGASLRRKGGGAGAAHHHHRGGGGTTIATTQPNHLHHNATSSTSNNMASRLVDEVQKDQVIAFATVKRRTCGTGAFDKNWLNLDCCGLFSSGLTYALHFFAVYAVCCVMIPPWMSYDIPVSSSSGSNGTTDGAESTAVLTERHLTWAGTLHSTIFCMLAAMAVFSHYKAMTTDPGAVPPDARPLEMSDLMNNNSNAKPPQGMRLCRRCKAFKPPRAHHCSVCKRCIIKMDHHCPWVNNCVGIGNHKYFLLFVFYTFLSCAYSMTLIITRFSTCVHLHHRRRHHMGAAAAAAEAALMASATKQNTCLDQPSQMLTMLFLIIEALLFGMFTSCMIFDQMEVVKHKTTHIDRLKGIEIGGSLDGIAEVFGISSTKKPNLSRFRLDWLSPFRRVCFSGGLQEEVYGFCVPIRETELMPLKNHDTSNGGNANGSNKNLHSVAEIV